MKAGKETLVVVVGAGASIKAGISSTEELTTLAKRVLPTIAVPGVPYTLTVESSVKPAERHFFQNNRYPSLSDILDQGLRADYGEHYDFERILHALEELETFVDARYNPEGWQSPATPVLGSFAELMRRFDCLSDETVLRTARFDVLKAIHRRVGCDCEDLAKAHSAQNAREQLTRIFESLAQHYRLVVIDFNYDDLLDRMEKLGWHDGFSQYVPDKFCYLFDPADWASHVEDGETHLLMHLHGSVRYGYRPSTTLRDATTRFAEPAWYERTDGAQESVAGRTVSGTTVDGDSADAAFIVSGYRKAGKMAYNARPYGYYYGTIMNVVPRARRLLMLGYGWRDTHVNTWLNEYVACQPERRTAVVTKRLGSQTLEHPESVGNARLAGPAWGAFRSVGYARNPGDLQTASPFKAVDGFALAPEGFIMAQEDESALLSFFIDE